MLRLRPIARRLFLFVVVIWLASTINFFIPRLTPRNPIEEKLLSLTEFGGSTVDIQSLVKAYNAKFGLDRPLALQ
ncbi:MAG: ABC transporter permease, partial [Nevskiales bacterium]